MSSETISIKDLNLNRPRYPQDQYAGRFWHFLDMTDIRNLFATETQCTEAKALLQRVQKREEGWKNVGVEEAWSAKKLVDSVFHPQTGEVIFKPFRFSAFLPMNIVTLFFMLHPSMQTPVRGMFWQWWNQTYNVCVNYANRNVSAEMSNERVATSYAIAVGTSCSVSVLGQKVVASMGAKAPKMLQMFVPYLAVAIANIVNVAAMRSSEVLEGIKVNDLETGEEIDAGLSPAAGRIAVGQVALSRILIPLPLMTLPPVVMHFLFDSGRMKFFAARRSTLYLPTNLAVLASLLTVIVPACIAVFPQDAIVGVSQLESKFQNKKNSKGNVVTQVTFNKGL